MAWPRPSGHSGPAAPPPAWRGPHTSRPQWLPVHARGARQEPTELRSGPRLPSTSNHLAWSRVPASGRTVALCPCRSAPLPPAA
eukprot:4540399-Alexandrium_andersonii.AAC.1